MKATTKNSYWILLLLCFFATPLFGQDGPGGVGNTDGAGDFVMWIIADSATVDADDSVTAVSNLVDITDLNMTIPGLQPYWESNGPNGHSEISFRNVNDALETSSTLNTSYFPVNETSTFFVSRHDNLSQQSMTYSTATAYDAVGGSPRFLAHIPPWADGAPARYDMGNCCGANDRISFTYEDAWMAEYGIFSYNASSTAGRTVRYNNTEVASAANTASFSGHGSRRFYLGFSDEPSSGNPHFEGDISEFIMYKAPLNDAQLNIVNNYLGSKYDLAIASDLYLHDNSHGNELVGIGQSGTDTHTNSKSAGILSIKSPTALDDGDYAFMGHDNASYGSWGTTELPNADANTERIAREWRVSVTGDPGTVTLSVDTAFLPAKSSDFDYYLIWTDVDGDFSSGATAYAVTLNGGEYEASGVVLSEGMYITVSTMRAVLNFAQTSFSGFETTSPATFQLGVDYAPARNITIDYTVSGTCTEDLPAAGTFTINAGSTSAILNVPITNSDGFESDETIIITLTDASADGATVGTDKVSTYTVHNSDAATNTVAFDAPFNYSHRKTITISKDMVSGSSDMTDFPVLIRVDGGDFTEMEANVQNGNGYDIRFTYENSVEWLDHQIERYDATNDYLLAWVNLPVLSASVDTKLEMYYGNASVSTDPSSDAVFDTATYEAVYHFEDVTDATYNGNDGALNGDATYASAKVGNGLTLDGNADYVEAPNDPSFVMTPTDKITLSGWYNGTDTQGEFISRMNSSNDNRGYSLRTLGGELSFLLIEGFPGGSGRMIRVATATNTALDGSWHYITATYDGSSTAAGVTIYIDGVATSTDINQLSDNLLSSDNTDPNIPFTIGRRYNSTNNWVDGLIDEVRVIRDELSVDWIKTEYNNMNAPGTYLSFATEVATSGFPILESTDTLNVTISLASTDANDVMVDYAITSGTASTPLDYTLASGTATISSGDLSTVITVDLSDDATDEQDETFTISLSNVTSVSDVSLGTNKDLQITLTDDDAGPVIGFVDTLATVNEGGALATTTVGLSSASGTDVTVDYTVTAKTATSGTDYVMTSGTLTIPKDSTSAKLSFNVIDDDEVETQETFAVELSNPTNSTIDTQYDSLTVSINDNDNFGIDGPGGVGDADGTGTLVMWMIADSATTSGSDVTAWENEVGITELNMTPPGTSPTLVSNARNGHAEISFANVNDALATSALSTAYFPYNEASTFMVTRHDNMSQRSNSYGTSTTQGGGLESGTNRFSSHMPWNGRVYYDIGSTSGGRSRFDYQAEWVGEYSLFSYVANSGSTRRVWRNDTQQDSDNGTANFSNHTNSYFHLGQTQSNDFRGDILEFIMYISPLNEAQRKITQNYLAAKYDIALDSDDFFSFNTTHSTEVAGIGREDASNFHLSAKSKFLTVNNASLLGDRDYVMFGHDNAPSSSWGLTDLPADLDSLRRLEIEWRFDTTGTPGTVSVSLDPSMLPALPSDYTEYVILTDDDGLFNDGATIYPTELVDGEYVANDVIVAQGTYLAVGTHIRTIEFIGNAVQDFENNNNTITVALSLQAKTDVTVSYTLAGTATQASDYSLAASGTVTIPAGSISKTIDFGVIDESNPETDETIIMTLSSPPSGYILGDDKVFTYTINDDDNDRSVNFDVFKYARDVKVNGGQITGTHSDFPVYFTYTHNDLRSLSQGGTLENSLGYDIAFYDSLNSTWLDHQLESYDSTTGEINVWIRIPSLSAGTDVDFTFLYGNAGVEFDQSTNSVWKSSYQGVWHMANDDYHDGTSNGLNGVDQGATETTGKVGGAASFDGNSNVKISDIANLSFGVADTYTISAWYKGTDASKTIAGLVDDNVGNGQGYDLYISNSNYLIGWQGNQAGSNNYIRGSAGGAINDDAWHYLVVTYNGTSGTAYTDGANAMGSQNGTLTGTLSPTVSFNIGSRSDGAAIARAITGDIDEVRVSNVVHSADWIATEYSNQNTPGTFLTVGTEQDTLNTLILAESADSIEVRLRVDPVDMTQATTIDFGDAATGSALITEDFGLTPATVTIPSGEQTGSFKFKVINDLKDEADETIVLNISNPSANAKLGSVNVTTYTVEDDDDLPTIAFVDTVSTANEGASVLPVSVLIDYESGNTITVDYEVKSSTATLGTDFVALSGTVTLNAGELSKAFSFQPIDDSDIEVPEEVEIRIFNPVNATLGDDTLHVVTIKDNDDLGYEGPGGVGDVANVGGENLLKLWLIADSVTTSGSAFSQWDNIVQNIGVDYNMVAPDNLPDVVDNAVNGHKEISFNNVRDGIRSTDLLTAASFPANELSIFIVTETDNLAQQSYAYGTDNNSNGTVQDNGIYGAIPWNGNTVFDLRNTTSTQTYQTGWAGNHSIFTHIVSSDTMLIYRNNTVLDNADPTGEAMSNQTNRYFWLGKESATDQRFQGDIAEVIMFSRDVNLAQIRIINNYLAAKYDLTITDDDYVFQSSHGVEVAGIGRVDIDNQHVAASAGLMTISNASDLGDNEFVMFGHDNADIGAWTTTEIPAAGINRVAREWRFDLTGTPGDITIGIDADMLPTRLTDEEDYVIIKDVDGDFTADAEIIETVLVDGLYKAANVSISSGDYVTLGIVTRTVSFAATTGAGFENVAANATVNLSLASSQDISLDYNLTDSTATGGNVDFGLATSGTVTFIAGQTSVNLPLGLINDTEVESDEVMQITLSNAPSGVDLADSVFSYTIRDDDNPRKIQFWRDSLTNDESVDSVYLKVQLDAPDTNPTKVFMSVSGGSAEASPAPDFNFTADTLTVAAGQTQDSLLVVILNDVLDEDDEDIIFTLSSPTNSNVGDTVNLVYTITDNDDPVTVQFQTTSMVIDEGGSIAQIVVELSSPSGQDVTVGYTVSMSGTATGGGVDYALADGTMVIPAGDQIKTINVSLTDDDTEEVAETVIIDLSVAAPIAASLGGNTQHTLTIADNDAEFGYYGPGGVGDASSNMLWLDAANINGTGVAGPSHGDAITTWTDRSGNDYDFTAVGAGGTAATYDSAGFNNFETISIGSGQHGFRAPSGFSNALSNYTFMAAVQQQSGNYLVENNTVASTQFRLNQGANGLYSLNNTDYLSANASTDLDVMTWILDAQATSSASVYRDGSSQASDNNYSVMGLANNFSIGNQYTGETTSDFEGYISEFIVFKKVLDDAQRIIVENYLAAKYGLTITNDLYDYEVIHGQDLVGIGNAGTLKEHLEAMSDSIFMISGASNLDSGEFVFAGHNGGDKLSWTSTEAPDNGTTLQRIEREWRIDTVGNPGTIIIKIDSDELPTAPSGYEQYVALIDDDGDFRYGATVYQLEYSPLTGLYTSDPVTVDKGYYATIGIDKPVVQFTSATGNGPESTATPNIEVSLNYVLGSDVTVNYSATSGSATNSNIDYLLTSGTLTIPAGQLTANIIPGVIDDLEQESDETIVITLTTPSSNASLGGNSEHTYTINDNDNARKIDFNTTTGTGDEATTPVLVDVQINTASNTATTVDITPQLTGSYAEEGTDYTLSTSTVTIPGDNTTTSVQFSINITDDTDFEGTETITLLLTSPTNANIGTNTTYTYTLTDNETAPTVSFTDTTSFINENAGTVLLEVGLSAVSAQDVTVDYTVSGGSAVEGVDFDLADGTLTIPGGSNTENILVTITDDGALEAAENITVTLSNPTVATLAANRLIYDLTILDNDAAGSVGPGGVGDATSNLLWLTGENFRTGTGTWSDQSGNSYDLTGGTTPGYTSSNGSFNSQPTLTFNGSQYLTASALSSTASDYDVFFVLQASSAANDQVLYHADDAGATDIQFRLEDSGGAAYLDQSGWKGSTVSIGTTNARILQLNLESGTGTAEVSIDNGASATSTYTPTSIGGTRYLGANSSGSSGFQGDMGEMIVYNYSLNTAQRKIVANYLGHKYGITITNDLYDETGGYGNSVFGIGRDDADNLHVEASDSILSIGNANDLQDGEFMLLGNDDGTINAWAQDTVNSPVYRISRLWKVDQTGGNVGAVTVELDSSLLSDRPADHGFGIMVSANTDFTDGNDSLYALTDNGTDVFTANGIELADGWYVSVVAFINISGGDGDFHSESTWTIGGIPGANDFVIIDETDSVYLTADASIGGLLIRDGGVLDLGGNTLTINWTSCPRFDGTGKIRVITTDSRVNYDAPTGTQCVAGLEYNDLLLGNGGTKRFDGAVTALGDVVVENNVTVNTNNLDLTLGGDFENSGTFNATTGSVTFNGTTLQEIRGSQTTTFNNMIVNKPSSDVTLSRNVDVSGYVDLTSGNVDFNISDLTIKDGGSIQNGGASSYFQVDEAGVLRYEIFSSPNDSLIFPVGDVDEYSPFTFKLVTGLVVSNSAVTINLKDDKHTNITMGNYITRYWSLNEENITGTIDYNVAYVYTNADVVGNEGLIDAAKFSPSGDAAGGTINTGTNTISYLGHTSFSDHTGEGETPLPVELLEIYLLQENGDVYLHWTTVSELNNDYFVVEYSLDGEEWEELAEIEGNGTTSELIKYQYTHQQPDYGLLYYRLRQVDFDGQYEYHPTLTIFNSTLNKDFELTVFPNPAQQHNINLSVSGVDRDIPIRVSLVDQYGRKYYDELVHGSQSELKLQPNAHMAAGIYYIVVQHPEKNKVLKLLIR